jgi:hypothetical protein
MHVVNKKILKGSPGWQLNAFIVDDANTEINSIR